MSITDILINKCTKLEKENAELRQRIENAIALIKHQKYQCGMFEGIILMTVQDYLEGKNPVKELEGTAKPEGKPE